MRNTLVVALLMVLTIPFPNYERFTFCSNRPRQETFTYETQQAKAFETFISGPKDEYNLPAYVITFITPGWSSTTEEIRERRVRWETPQTEVISYTVSTINTGHAISTTTTKFSSVWEYYDGSSSITNTIRIWEPIECNTFIFLPIIQNW